MTDSIVQPAKNTTLVTDLSIRHVPIEEIVDRSLRFQTTDEIIQFVNTAQDQLSDEDFIRLLDKAVAYFTKFVTADTEFVNDDLFEGLHTSTIIGFIRTDIKRCSSYISEDEYIRLLTCTRQILNEIEDRINAEELQAASATIASKLHGPLVSAD